MYGGTASGNPADAIGAGVIDSELAQIDGQLDVASLLDTQSTTADSVLGSITDLLNDASTLVIASAGNTISDAERQANQTQMDSILDTINRLGSNPNINSNAWIKLGDLTADDVGTISIGSVDFFLSDVGSGQPLNLLNGNLDGAALSIDQAINDISDMREEIGSCLPGQRGRAIHPDEFRNRADRQPFIARQSHRCDGIFPASPLHDADHRLCRQLPRRNSLPFGVTVNVM